MTSLHDERNIEIKQAFIDLLKKKPMDSITVKEISEVTGITRQNIYRHFSSKEKIFESILNDLLDFLFSQIERNLVIPQGGGLNSIVNQGFTLMYEHRDIVEPIFLRGNDQIFYNCVRAFTNRSMGYITRVNGLMISDRALFDIITHYVAAASIKAITKWIEGGMSISIDNMVALVSSTVNPVLLQQIQFCTLDNTAGVVRSAEDEATLAS